MPLSPDLITNIVFGIIMVVIGIVAIWVVRWQTYFLLRIGRVSVLGNSLYTSARSGEVVAFHRQNSVRQPKDTWLFCIYKYQLATQVDSQ
jgi:hypothetical protein